jgi:RHS repeat-associated protein
LNTRDAAGQWQPIDTSLRFDSRAKRAKPVRQGLAPSFAEKADDPALVSVDVDGRHVSLGLKDAAPNSRIQVDGSTGRYKDVLPKTDLEYEVTAGDVKETIVLHSKPESAQWRFRLDAGGLTPEAAKDGTVRFTDDKGALKLVMPPIETWDSTGDENTPPATTGGTYGLERDGDHWALTVSVDEKWLSDSKRKYPVRVDPTFSYGVIDSVAYRTDGTTCQNCGLRIGNSQAAGDTYNRSALRFDYSPLFGRTVVGARMDVARNTSVTGSVKTWDTSLYHASSLDINGLGALLATALVGDVGSFADPRFTGFLRHVVDTRQAAYFMLVGSEIPGTWTYKNLNATLTVDVGSAPPAAVLSSPADGSVLTSLTPTLKVNPVSDPDGDAVKYCFTVATGHDARSGVVVDSGCLTTPTWTVPENVLHDGVAYTWQATTYSGATMTSPPWVGHFRVDQRLGSQGPAPRDSVGPVTVNLANGNVHTSQDGPTFNTVAGNSGLTFSYNSQQAELKGLKTSYFTDLSHNGIINPSQQPVLVRTEPQVNVNWGADSPFPPALAPDWFVVRWEGYFQAPVAGSYQFAGLHDDGLTVWVNNNKAYEVNTASDVNWTQSTSVNLTAGQRVPIKVELAEKTGHAQLRLFTRTSDNTTVPPQIVPAGWFHNQDLPALPKGWAMSSDIDGDGLAYTEAKVTDQTVVLTDSSGAKHTWTKKSTGGYSAPEGDTGVLGLDGSGKVTLTDGADIYVFRVDGKLETQSTVADSRKPAALQQIYDGTPARLREIKDPVSGRSHRLHYNRAGDDCGQGTPSDYLPPSQMLCRIVYWDGSQTRLFFSQGNLIRIEDPGSELTDFGYSAERVLNGIRDSLIMDWIAADLPNRLPLQHELFHGIGYDTTVGKPKAVRVDEPAPAPGQPRPSRSFRYDQANRQTFVDHIGLNPAIGFHTKVTYDDAERELSTTDATGATTRQSWNHKDQKLSTTDSAGRVTTTVYDYADRVTDTYGPAPASCFAGQVPTAACAATVPHTRTGYDEGINGLFASYYANNQLSGTPKVFTTGTGATDGSLINSWARNAPTADIPADGFSLRLSGEIVFPEAGDYKLRLLVDDGIRVWVDDKNIIDDWRGTTAAWREATVRSDGPGSIKKLRLDYMEIDQDARLELHWTTPGGVQQPVPGSALRPRYGLTTSTTFAESAGVPNKVTTTKYGENGVDAVFGLASSSTKDAGGLNVKTASTIETPGTGYLRTTAKTMPNGEQTTYAFYGAGETRADPCVSGSAAANQGALNKSTSTPAPLGGTPRVDEIVYDASGRVVAKGTSGDWECTTYDSRDRVVKRTFPGNATAPARTVTTDYTDPLATKTTDPSGTITSTTDLLGRVVSYVDANGVKSEKSYDRIGRVTSEKVTPPAGGSQLTEFTYDDAGRTLTTKVDTAVLSTAAYNASGELSGATYANGSSLTSITKDGAGRALGLTWKTSDGNQISSTVTRTRNGTIIDEATGGVDARPDGSNFLYDGAGRLHEAYVRGHKYNYDFYTNAHADCPTGTKANAGLNTNRMWLRDTTSAGTATTAYCYDAADRVVSTLGTNAVTGIKYDKNGNTVEYTAGGSTTFLGFDGTDRHLTARTAGPDAADVSYVRDATDRIVRRAATAGDQQAVVRYGFTADGDASDLALNDSGAVLSRTFSLPGGVLYTAKPGAQPSWDHASVRGNLFLETDAAGKRIGELREYTPFGEPVKADGVVDADNVPDNQPGQMDNGWLGQHQRPYEHAGALSIVQMGARPYLPILGRFLSVDPVDGGSANDYDYVAGDPVNLTDLDGTWIWFAVGIKACIRWCVKACKRICPKRKTQNTIKPLKLPKFLPKAKKPPNKTVARINGVRWVQNCKNALQDFKYHGLSMQQGGTPYRSFLLLLITCIVGIIKPV